MIVSERFRFEYAKSPAHLRIVRNNGECWAEVRTDAGERLAVATPEDYCDRTDEEAAEAFIEAAGDPICIEPSVLDLTFPETLERAAGKRDL